MRASKRHKKAYRRREKKEKIKQEIALVDKTYTQLIDELKNEIIK